MNASASGFCCAVLVLIWGVTPLLAQDIVLQKDNQRREGEIVGVAERKLKIKVGPAETSIPLEQVASVVKPAPREHEEAMKAWQEGNANKTLSLLKPLVEKFRGLQTDWAERASALLGDVYLSLDKHSAAEAAFAEFTKAYPDAKSLSELGLARLAVFRKDFADAKSRLAPMVSEAESVVVADATKSATYGQVFYLMGLVRENEGAYPEALGDYLRAVTLFHGDNATVAKAQERAEFLMKEKQVIVP
jgi:tetratricopeptide (TPR) repeat protein